MAAEEEPEARAAVGLAVLAPVLLIHLVAPAVQAGRASVAGMRSGPYSLQAPAAQAAAAALARVQAAAVPPAVLAAAAVARNRVLLEAEELEECLWASYQAPAASLRRPASPLPPLQLQPVLRRAHRRRRCLPVGEWATEAVQAAAWVHMTAAFLGLRTVLLAAAASSLRTLRTWLQPLQLGTVWAAWALAWAPATAATAWAHTRQLALVQATALMAAGALVPAMVARALAALQRAAAASAALAAQGTEPTAWEA